MHLNLSKREKYIFIVVVGTVISALAYNFIFERIVKRWTILNNEIVVARAVLRKGERLVQNKTIIIKEYNTYAASLKNISKILSYIETKAGSFGLKTANIRPRPQVQKGLYTEYIIELQIEGDFANISRFISELIQLPVVVRVKKFDLRTVKDTPSHLKGTLILSKLTI